MNTSNEFHGRVMLAEGRVWRSTARQFLSLFHLPPAPQYDCEEFADWLLADGTQHSPFWERDLTHWKAESGP